MNACKYLDGAILYGTPWSSKKGADQLENIYIKAIGLVLSETIRKEQLPQLRPYIDELDFKHYASALASNWDGLKTLDEHLFKKMFGYSSAQDYYDRVTIAEHVT